MLLNCNSCQKKFIVPDSAITISGRLVQCGSCGSKWTQYPSKNNKLKKTETVGNIQLKEKKITKNKSTVQKPRVKKNLYTPEYLKKKYGLSIGGTNNTTNNEIMNDGKNKNSFGFYSWLFIFLIFIITIFGILDLTKEMIILKFSSSEIYISYLYEVIEIVKISIIEFVNQFNN